MVLFSNGYTTSKYLLLIMGLIIFLIICFQNCKHIYICSWVARRQKLIPSGVTHRIVMVQRSVARYVLTDLHYTSSVTNMLRELILLVLNCQCSWLVPALCSQYWLLAVLCTVITKIRWWKQKARYTCRCESQIKDQIIRRVVLTFITLTCFRNTSVLTVR